MENTENTVKMIEEVKPSEGYTEEGIKNNYWNSPPPRKGYGRYRLTGKNIAPGDFAELKTHKEIYYWDREFLEEMDMFYDVPGWRLDTRGIERLKQKGYNICIDSIDDQNKRIEEKEKLRKEIDIQKEANEKEYKRNVEEYENWLGNPKWVLQKENDIDREGDGNRLFLKRIRSANATTYTDEYMLYELTPNGYIYSHRHYGFDMWDNVYSDEPAPAHVVAEANTIAETKKKAAIEKENKEIYLQLKCPSCGRTLYMRKNKVAGRTIRCGKCHTGKKATDKTTVAFNKVAEVERQHIPEGSEIAA